MKIIDLNEEQLEYVETQLSAFDEKYITCRVLFLKANQISKFQFV